MKSPAHPAARALACVVCAGVAGCGNAPHEEPAPPRPATVSLAIGSTEVDEAANPRVPVRVNLDANAASPVTVELEFQGTATPGSDYALDRQSVTVPASAASATAEIDVYRDFDEELDETVEVRLGVISGFALAGTPNAATLTIRDGGAAVFEEPEKPEEPGPPPGLELFPLAFTLAEPGVLLLLVPLNSSGDTAPLVVESSTDWRFLNDVQTLATVDVESSTDPVDPFLQPLAVAMPRVGLAARQAYYLRAYLGAAPSSDAFGSNAPNLFFDGFTTDASGRVAVRCIAPARTAAEGGDPLFDEQWHLVNTGQAAFSDRGGVPGADLRMSGAIAADLSGAGVKLAVVDSGLETCHPDLAANARENGSYNFAYSRMARFGARVDEPYYFSLLGDHGTSVAGIAAAAADNGLGGRGVAPEVSLVGFNPAEAFDVGDPELRNDFEVALLQSLGGSSAAPDSASVDVFNMSFGIEAPGSNSPEEFVRLYRMATTELRSGRGALYAKAAGNDFERCRRFHPLNPGDRLHRVERGSRPRTCRG